MKLVSPHYYLFLVLLCWVGLLTTAVARSPLTVPNTYKQPLRRSSRSIRPLATVALNLPRGGSDADGPGHGGGGGSMTASSPPTTTTTKSTPTKSSATATPALASIVGTAFADLASSIQGGKSDTLLLLLTTALVPTLCNMISVSPILGFLASGLALGPQGMNVVADLHRTEHLADLGVVLFLFEMGVHLSLKTLWDMRKIVFGLGGLQMAVTGGMVALVARACGLDLAAQVVLGGGLALSSSAFVLQLLKDKDQLETTKGKHSFGVLLLQDLAVVPLLVVTPLLAGSGDTSVTTAVMTALIQAGLALTLIAAFGATLLKPLFTTVLGKSQSQEAAIAISMVTILGMSFLTEGLGLSNTLGAFLAGVLLSECSFVHTVEREVSPIRGILVGLFFFSVGFELDLPLLFSPKIKEVLAIVFGLMVTKTAILTILCKFVTGLDTPTSQSIGFLLSQGGEFAFVAFRLARSYNILDPEVTKLLLTSVSLTMALTPLAEELGSKLAAPKKPPPPPMEDPKEKKNKNTKKKNEESKKKK
jgi:CPA2 family monovalent cation:H+ antiporter-2